MATTTDHSKEISNITARIDKINNHLISINGSEKELSALQQTVRIALNIPEDMTDIDDAIISFSKKNSDRISALNQRARTNDETREKLLKNLEKIRGDGPSGTCPFCMREMGDHFKDIIHEYESLLMVTGMDGEEIDKELDAALEDTHLIPGLKSTIERIREIQGMILYRGQYEMELAELQTRLKILEKNRY